jgi:hypothetical protein
MAISEIFTNKAGHLYSPDGESYPDAETALREGIAGFRSGLDGEIPRIEAEGDIALAQGPLTKAELLLAERIEFEGEVALATGPQTDASRAAALSTLKGAKFDADRWAEMSGTRVGRIEVTGLGAKEKETARIQAKARADAFAREQQLLALQAMLDALNVKLEGLYEERDGLFGKYLSPEEQDNISNLPEDQKYQATIDAHKRMLEEGRLTQEQYDAWLNEWERVNHDITDTKHNLAETHQKISEHSLAIQADALLRGHDVSTVSQMNAFISNSERDERLGLSNEAIMLASKTAELEQRKLSLTDLERYKGTDEYIAKIDEFVAGADEHTVGQLFEGEAVDPEIRTRIGLIYLKKELADLDQFKGTPDYQAFVQQGINDAPESVREALRNEPDLSEAVTVALYEPFSDTLDEAHSLEQPIETAEADNSVQINLKPTVPSMG